MTHVSVCVSVCLNLLAWLMDGPVVQVPHHKGSTVVYVVVRTVQLYLAYTEGEITTQR